MTALCLDELQSGLKQRWGWAPSATHVPATPACPLLVPPLPSIVGPAERTACCRPLPAPANGWPLPCERSSGIGGIHGKPVPSMG